MAATHPKNWRVDPTKYTYQTESLFTNFHLRLDRSNPDIRSYDRYIHLMHAESLLRIKTEMTSTQRRDNLNIIYNHVKLMHFYLFIYASQNTDTVFIFNKLMPRSFYPLSDFSILLTSAAVKIPIFIPNTIGVQMGVAHKLLLVAIDAPRPASEK